MDSPYERWLEHAPLAFGVLRGGRFVYGNRALLELLGVSLETFVAMRFVDPIAPEDRDRVAERHARRLANEPVPNTYRFAVLRADGSRRDVQIFVERNGDDVVFQMLDHTEESSRQAKVRAIARLGATLHSHRSDAEVMRAAQEGLCALGLSVVRLAPIGENRMRLVDASLADEKLAARFESSTGQSLVGLKTARGEAFDACWRTGSVYVDDAPLSGARLVTGRPSEAVAHVLHEAGLAQMVLLRIDRGGTPDHVFAVLGNWLRPEDLPTLALFGTQISTALDAANVISDLSLRNAELAALNHVAGAAGSTSDISSLFARAIEEISTIFASPAVGVNLIDEERQEAVAVRWLGAKEAPENVMRVPLAGSLLGVVAREGVSRVWRVEEYSPPFRQMLEQMGLRVVVSVPLRVRSVVVGIMNVGFPGDAPVPRRVEVLENMAAHLAAAVEASRLVDDLRQSYQRLSHTQEQLVQRERLAALGELAAAVAHEVRNPLGVIFNSLTSLKKLLPEDDKTKMLFAILDEEAARINHIVTDLLDFARPAFPSLHPGPLHGVLDEAIDAAQSQAPENVRFVREIDTNLATIAMDPRLLRQALLNVLENAIQAMPSGGTVTIRASRARRGDREMARVEIRDTGTGIGSVELPRIFEPFFTTRATGTGLGLAVVKRIIDSHRGTIEVESTPGEGSAFVFWLEASAG